MKRLRKVKIHQRWIKQPAEYIASAMILMILNPLKILMVKNITIKEYEENKIS
jgi:hypothetical protein